MFLCCIFFMFLCFPILRGWIKFSKWYPCVAFVKKHYGISIINFDPIYKYYLFTAKAIKTLFLAPSELYKCKLGLFSSSSDLFTIWVTFSFSSQISWSDQVSWSNKINWSEKISWLADQISWYQQLTWSAVGGHFAKMGITQLVRSSILVK